MIKTNNKETLLELSDFPEDRWTIDDAMKGIAIMGGTGSGKTTSSGMKLALKYLEAGWGGVVLCAKSDEASLWEWYCKKAKRSEDLIRFGKNTVFKEKKGQEFSKGLDGQLMVFNPIDYEMKRDGEGAGETQNLTNIFMNIYRMGNRIAGESDTKEERYWDTALKRCLNRVIELLKLAKEDLSYSNMISALTSVSHMDPNEVNKNVYLIKQGTYLNIDPNFKNYCGECIINAYFFHFYGKEEEGELWETYRSVCQYFMKDIPAMGDKTRTTVTESFMGLAEPFLSGILSKHFSGASNVKPEWTYQYQKIIVLDFPIKEFLDSGIIAQSVFKLLFQQAIERRIAKDNPTPVFLWCDEAHYFVNPYDQIFLTTARSSRTSTVYLSQNISNYFAIMGASEGAKSRVYSLMGNLATKIFHANSDVETNEYASKLIGHTLQFKESFTQSQHLASFGYETSETKAIDYLPQVPNNRFTTLKSGGENHNFEVEAIVFVTGKKWSDGANFLETTFVQDFENYLV